MSPVRYLFCWFWVALAGWDVYTQQWEWMAVSIGMFVLLIADAAIEALKGRGRK